MADTYPRDAHWLWLRIEEFQTSRAGGSWVPVAEFRIRNKSRVTGAALFPTLRVTNLNMGELSFGIDGITVVTQADAQHDIWNHVVTAQFRVASNGVPLTNWDQPYVRPRTQAATGVSIWPRIGPWTRGTCGSSTPTSNQPAICPPKASCGCRCRKPAPRSPETWETCPCRFSGRSTSLAPVF